MTTPTFYMVPSVNDCSFHAQLAVCCTNGQVFNLKWEISGVSRVPGRESQSVSSINMVSLVSVVSAVSVVLRAVSVGSASCGRRLMVWQCSAWPHSQGG